MYAVNSRILRNGRVSKAPHRRAVVEDGAWVPEKPVASVHAKKRPARREHFEAAADVKRKEGIARTERACERRWEDEDAAERPRRFAERDEAGPQLRERPHATDAGAHRRAEQSFQTTATERGRIRKVAGIDRDLAFQPHEAGWIPRQPAAEPSIGPIELARDRRRHVDAKLRARGVRLCD